MEFDKALMSRGEAFATRSSFSFDVPATEVIQITKGVPTPSGRKAKYPFRDMEVGDSFFAPGSSVIGMHGCARRYRPMRFTCRTVIEHGVPGIRVWRIA